MLCNSGSFLLKNNTHNGSSARFIQLKSAYVTQRLNILSGFI
jgi:hypothetical protein